ncbi:hypothetical protein [Candidiatus Paracoxiella cheracis]
MASQETAKTAPIPVPQQINNTQACRDARDRLLPSLSIIDSQYATT